MSAALLPPLPTSRNDPDGLGRVELAHMALLRRAVRPS